jgi:hypothetical protein
MERLLREDLTDDRGLIPLVRGERRGEEEEGK